MSSDTPTILKKILARKHEEIAERSAQVSIPQLIEKAKTASDIPITCTNIVFLRTVRDHNHQNLNFFKIALDNAAKPPAALCSGPRSCTGGHWLAGWLAS